MSELSERLKAFGKYIEIGKGLGYAITIDQLAELQALEKERDEYKGVMLHIDEQINSRRNYIPKWLRDRITAVLTGNL